MILDCQACGEPIAAYRDETVRCTWCGEEQAVRVPVPAVPSLDELLDLRDRMINRPAPEPLPPDAWAFGWTGFEYLARAAFFGDATAGQIVDWVEHPGRNKKRLQVMALQPGWR